MGKAPKLLSVSTIWAGSRRASTATVLEEPVEHVLAVAGEGQLEEGSREARAGLDERDEAAAGDVQPLESPFEVVPDLVDEPVAATVPGDYPFEGEGVLDLAAGLHDPGTELRFVGT